jgi:protoporphyrinogen/coproporphyrinogen III oxidase
MTSVQASEPASDPAPASRRIAVIGGGLAGLLVARALERDGVAVCVFESATQLGGLLETSRADGYLHEHAASSFLAKAGGMLDLCRALEVPVVKACAGARRRWIFIDGKRREVPAGAWSLLRSDLLTLRGKLALLAEPLRPARRVDQVGDQSVYDFAVRRLGPQVARSLVAPFVTGIFAADAHDVSLQAGFPQLAELDARGGLVRGMIANMVRPRRAPETLSRGAAPAPSRLARADRGLWAPRDGMAEVVRALHRDLRGELRLGCDVVELVPHSRGVEVISAGRRESFAGVVSAVSAARLARLLPTVPEAARRLVGFHRAPAAVVSLGYRRSDFTAPLDGFGMLVSAGEKPRVLGVVFESVLWPGRAPDDRVLLRCIFAGARDPQAYAFDDEELIAIATADIATTLEIAAPPVHAVVTRWAEGIAPFRVGHRQRVLEAEIALRGHRIAIAGADFRGVGLNGLCLDTPAVVAETTAW